MMKILVTGASGFIGGHLTKALLDSDTGSKIHSLVRATPDKELRNSIVKEFPYDGTVESISKAVEGCSLVIHLAGCSRDDSSDESLEENLQENILLSARLFQAVANKAPKAGVVIPNTIDAFEISTGMFEPKNFFESSKYAVEMLAESFPIKTTFLRLPETYGTGDKRGKLHNCLMSSVRNREVEFFFNKPEYQLLNMMSVTDVIRALLIAGEQLKTIQIPAHLRYDLIYPENNISIGDVANIITANSYVGLNFPLFGDTTSVNLAVNTLPNFQPIILPEDGLKRLVR